MNSQPSLSLAVASANADDKAGLVPDPSGLESSGFFFFAHASNRVSHEKSHLACCHQNMHPTCMRGTTRIKRKLGEVQSKLHATALLLHRLSRTFGKSAEEWNENELFL